ncbi:MAG: ATPase domain-containing protein [Thermoplasmata archaeon]
MKKDDLLRMKSGIAGLDIMLEGGFPFPSTILLAGAAGTGKTTFCLQFLMEGAKNGEKGLFFTTLSEPTSWMLRYTSRFNFINPQYFNREIKYIEIGQVIVDARDYREILDYLDEQIGQVQPQRIVIDPVTVIEHVMKGNYREFLYQLSVRLKNWQATSIITGEVLPDQMYPVEVSYTADGVILLTYELLNDGRRKYLEILKMRGTNHHTGRHLMDITYDGVQVQPGLR